MANTCIYRKCATLFQTLAICCVCVYLFIAVSLEMNASWSQEGKALWATCSACQASSDFYIEPAKGHMMLQYTTMTFPSLSDPSVDARQKMPCYESKYCTVCGYNLY